MQPKYRHVDSRDQLPYATTMPTPTSSIENLKRALAIAEQIQKLEDEYMAILGGKPAAAPATLAAPNTTAPAPEAGKRGGKRTMSAATRAKMAAAAKARWAKKSGGTTKLVEPIKPIKAARKKRVLSPEGRARIVAAVKARHAAARK